MAKPTDKFLPLSQVNAYLPDRLHMNVAFPHWFEQDQIGVNVQRLVGLLTLGGIQLLDVQGKFERETTQVKAVARGVKGMGGQSQGQGEGATTFLSPFHTSNVPTYRQKADGLLNYVDPHAARWVPAMTVDINLSEISQRVRDQGGSVKEPDGWATYIDQAVRRSVRKEGQKHLMQLSIFDLVLYVSTTITTLTKTSEFMSTYEMNHPETLLKFIAERAMNIATVQYLYMLFMVVLNRNIQKKDFPYRLSLLPLGPEFDRALVLSFMANKPLIRPMKGLEPEQIHVLNPKAELAVAEKVEEDKSEEK